MTKTGNEKDAAHAEQLKQLTEQSQKQLAEQEAQLMQRINDCEGKIATFEQQIRDKDAELATKQKAIDDATGAAQNSAQNLQQQIDALKLENQNLIERLMAASVAINDAADDLQRITDDVPNATTKQEVDALLNEITQQIEQSIINISRAAQGQPVAAATPSNQQGVRPKRLKIPGDTQISLNDIAKKQQVLLTVNQLLESLKRKADSHQKPNKYSDAIDGIMQLNSVSGIQGVLSNNNIIFKNDDIMGGKKKTKKNRKQKGGFTYSSNTKRRSITSKNSSRKTSRKSSR